MNWIMSENLGRKKESRSGKGGTSKSEPSTRPKGKAEQIGKETFTWKLTKEEIEKRTFHLRYNARSDCYYRLSSSHGEEYRPAIEGWENGVFGSMNIQRCHAINRHGQEWAYLTRKARCRFASISWWLDFRDSGLVIDDVSAFTYGRTLRNGRLTYDLLSPDSVPSDSIRRRNRRSKKLILNGWQSLLIVAHLEGGVGKRQEDETQLFLQDCISQPDFCPLDITITLKPLEFVRCNCHLSRKLPPLRRTATERNRSVSCSTISGTATRQSQSLRQPVPPLSSGKRPSNLSWIPSAAPVVAEQQSKQQRGDNKDAITSVGYVKPNHRSNKGILGNIDASTSVGYVKPNHRSNKDILGTGTEGYVNPAHTTEEEVNSPTRIPSAAPIVAELQPSNSSGDHLQMVTQVGSVKRKKKKPPRSKTHGDQKTHPASENRLKTTEVMMQNTIATIAIKDQSAGPSHDNVRTGLAYTSGKREDQQENKNNDEIISITDTRDRGSRCILL